MESNEGAKSKKEMYRELIAEAHALVKGEADAIANMANISSVVFHSLNRYRFVSSFSLPLSLSLPYLVKPQ